MRNPLYYPDELARQNAEEDQDAAYAESGADPGMGEGQRRLTELGQERQIANVKARFDLNNPREANQFRRENPREYGQYVGAVEGQQNIKQANRRVDALGLQSRREAGAGGDVRGEIESAASAKGMSVGRFLQKIPSGKREEYMKAVASEPAGMGPMAPGGGMGVDPKAMLGPPSGGGATPQDGGGRWEPSANPAKGAAFTGDHVINDADLDQAIGSERGMPLRDRLYGSTRGLGSDDLAPHAGLREILSGNVDSDQLRGRRDELQGAIGKGPEYDDPILADYVRERGIPAYDAAIGDADAGRHNALESAFPQVGQNRRFEATHQETERHNRAMEANGRLPRPASPLDPNRIDSAILGMMKKAEDLDTPEAQGILEAAMERRSGGKANPLPAGGGDIEQSKLDQAIAHGQLPPGSRITGKHENGAVIVTTPEGKRLIVDLNGE